ncbi:hypothetical protein ACFXJ5_01815 [Streptomyces sp. NPDC059373]
MTARWDADRQRWASPDTSLPPGPVPPMPPTPPGPYPEPVAPPGPRLSPPLLAALAVVTVGVLVAGGLWLAKGDPKPQQPLAGGSSSASGYAEPTDTYTDTSSSSPYASGSPTPTESAYPTLPDGYQAVTDDKGFALYVPVGWKRVVDGDQIYYTPDNKKQHLIQIGSDAAHGRTPYEALQTVESEDLSKRADYQQISFQVTGTDANTDASAPAELAYSYTNTKSGPRSAIDHAFLTSDGSTIYYLLVAGPSDEWTDTQAVFANVIGSFCDGVDPCSGQD